MGKSFSSKFLWQSLSLQHSILISYSRQLEQLALIISIELANNYYILKKMCQSVLFTPLHNPLVSWTNIVKKNKNP